MRRTRKRLRHRPHALYPIGFRSFPNDPPIANDHESLYAVVRCVGFEVFDRILSLSESTPWDSGDTRSYSFPGKTSILIRMFRQATLYGPAPGLMR